MALPTGTLFDEPQAKPLSTTGVPMPGAYYLFYATTTTTPANVYADGFLTTPLSQTPGQAQPSCTADANGRFNPIYLDPKVTYRVQLYNSSGVKLEDVDPYVVPANIAALNATVSSGSGALTLSEASGSTTVNYSYVISPGGVVTLSVSSGVLNSTSGALALQGLPTAIQPTSGNSYCALPCIENNSVTTAGGVIQFSAGSGSAGITPNGVAGSFASTGVKGIPFGFTVTYPLAGITEH